MVAIVERAGAPDNHPQTAIYLRIERGRESGEGAGRVSEKGAKRES